MHLTAFWHQLTDPQEGDEDLARREYMTRVILVMTAATMVTATIPIAIGWMLESFDGHSLLIMALCDLILAGALWLAQRGKWRLSRYVPTGIIFSLATMITYTSGFLNTGLLFYVAAILLTSMLFGIKAQLAMVVLSILTYLAAGWANDPSSLDLVPVITMTVSSSFVGIALLQWLLVQQMNKAIQRARLNAEALEHRTLELVDVNKELHQENQERERAEKLLRESEERYRTLFENATIGLVLADLDGNIIAYNDALLEPGSYSGEDLTKLDHSTDLYYKPEDGPKIEALFAEQGSLQQYEVQLKRKDGSPYDSLLSLTQVYLDGKPYILAMVEDITERKRAENEILTVNRALKVLNSCNQAVIRATEESRLLHEICRIITEEGNYHFAWVGFTQPDQRVAVRSVAQAGFEAGYLEKLPFVESGNGRSANAGQKIQTGKLEIARHIDTDRDLVPRHLEALTGAYTSSISLPLIANEKNLGSLNIYSEQADAFHAEEVSLLEKLADNLAFGIGTLRTRSQHRQAEQRIQRQLQTMSALRTVDMTITASLDLRFTFDVILNQIVSTLRVDAATILVYKPQIQTLDFAAGRGFRTAALQHTHLRLGQGNAGRAALERQVIHIPDLNKIDNELGRSPKFPDEDFVVYFGVPLIAKGQVKGVLEIFNRSPLNPDQEWMDLLKAMAAQTAIAVDNAELFRGLQQSNQDLLMAYEFTLEGWAKALELRDAETEGHTQRVTEMTLRLARAMGVSEENMVDLRRGTLLHDIGKMGIPDSILLKPGPLSDDEWEIMRQHPVYAYRLLSHIPYLRPAVDIPYCHHEKWDGTGYPRALKGAQIPLSARIFAVVDVWDALSSDRPYRDAWPEEKVRQYIKEQSGRHFDPAVAEAFLKLI